jgi:excisionase family DNA binding protein
MTSLAYLNNFIQKHLVENNIDELSAVDLAKVLDENGLLKDSKSRPGLPLRRLLRSNRIIGNYQYPNKRWVIRQSKSEVLFSPKEVAEKLKLTVQNIYAMIENNKIKYKSIGDKKLITKSVLEYHMIKRGLLENDKMALKTIIFKEVEEIELKIKEIIHRLETIKKYLNHEVNNGKSKKDNK